MIAIPVTPKRFRTFDTAAEAFSRPMTHPLRPKLDGYIEALAGTQLLDAKWSETQFLFHFSNGLSLDVTLDEHDICWSLEESSQRISTELPSLPICFDWGGSIGIRTEDVPRFVATRIGCDFVNLCVNDDYFYVYFRRKLILSFSTAFRTDTGEPLFYICEDE